MTRYFQDRLKERLQDSEFRKAWDTNFECKMCHSLSYGTQYQNHLGIFPICLSCYEEDLLKHFLAVGGISVAGSNKVICFRTFTGRPLVLGLGFNKEIAKHSLGGFEWGYHGSGPAELAYQLLYLITDDQDLSWKWHQEFKREFIAPMPEEGGIIKFDEIREWLKNKGE